MANYPFSSILTLEGHAKIKFVGFGYILYINIFNNLDNCLFRESPYKNCYKIREKQLFLDNSAQKYVFQSVSHPKKTLNQKNIINNTHKVNRIAHLRFPIKLIDMSF